MAGAIEVRAFIVTCPPQTTSDDPQITDLVMPTRTVLKIRVRIPPGPLSSMGFQLGMSETAIIPFNDGSYIIDDNETFEWDNQGWPNSGAWQAIMYNNGQYPHSIYVYFTVQLPDLPPVTALDQLAPAESLGSALPPAAADDAAGDPAAVDSES